MRSHPEFLLVVLARGQYEVVPGDAERSLHRRRVGTVQSHAVHLRSSDELHKLHLAALGERSVTDGKLCILNICNSSIMSMKMLFNNGVDPGC